MLYCNSRRAVSIGLVISLLATSTPAASPTIVGVSREWHASLGFWLRANNVPAKLYRALTGQAPEKGKPQEKQKDRDDRVSRIQIYPGDVTLGVDDRINLAAVAYDRDDGPVGGVQFTWEARDEDRANGAVVSPNGEFEALVPGRFKVTVQGAGKDRPCADHGTGWAATEKGRGAYQNDISLDQRSAAQDHS